MLIFEHAHPGRRASAQAPVTTRLPTTICQPTCCGHAAMLPERSELDVVRHYTGLSQKNFSIDTQFYPLGSCTMKYNPRACNSLAMLPQFLGRHPLADANRSGFPGSACSNCRKC
jgi:glycine dehydrogenase subunit 2